jgi:hypothetical protein
LKEICPSATSWKSVVVTSPVLGSVTVYVPLLNISPPLLVIVKTALRLSSQDTLRDRSGPSWVGVGVTVFVEVVVTVGVEEAVKVGVIVRVDVRLGVMDGVNVLVGVCVAVLVGVSVLVGVMVRVDVIVWVNVTV